jgi:S-adenosylmethionine:tRNA ribosyltransferase-isomerase
MAVVEPVRGATTVAPLATLPGLLDRGDLLVLNDAATLPASLQVQGEALELRLLQRLPDGAWDVALLGAGDWRTLTEQRPAPRELRVGERLSLVGGLTARIDAKSPVHPRRVRLVFEQTDSALWRGLYAGGRAVQYAHLNAPLSLWDVQTAFPGRPWATEAPSAGHALSWELLLALRRRGVVVARITHGCGLSSTGEPALDAALPVKERYEVPAETVEAIARAHASCRRVIAVGTSVVRALESWAQRGERAGWTTLRLGPSHTLRVVDGILSGMHQEGESHHALLQAFAPAWLLARATEAAEREGFLNHEYGDLTLLLPERGRCVSASRPRGRARRSRCPVAA